MGQQAFPAAENLSELKVIHVVRDLDTASGGPSRTVPALAESLAAMQGVNCEVHFEERGNKNVDLPSGPVEYRTGESMWAANTSTGRNTIIHVHGLWSFQLSKTARAARTAGIPYVYSTRGMLAP